MKKIVGLDLGVTSIGWAFILENEGKKEILGMGSRIIPLNTDDKDEFSSGNKISKNQKRTTRRTQRKGYDRYQARRKNLTNVLLKNGMFDESLFKLKPLDLWGLRAKSVSEKITLPELGRVLYHLNQKRGYKSSRSDANLDKKDTEYVAEVKNRHQEITEQGVTIGQKFYDELSKNEHYRIKQQVFPREAYIEEFDAIVQHQQKYYPEILSAAFVLQIRNEIIYYQRKLKSQKGLVSVCEFEGFRTKNKEGKEAFVGPKVAHRSSPLFQVCKIWESINSIAIKNKKGETLPISLEQKKVLFEHLDSNEKLSSAKLFELLGLKKNEGWYSNKQIERGLQGNLTKSQLLKYLDKENLLLAFHLDTKDINGESYLVDKRTGEIKESRRSKIIAGTLEGQPLYQLWHTIYSINDMEECCSALMNKFNIEKSVAESLAKIDFTRHSFGNKSVKCMRKILPYLMDGEVYSDACSYAGYNHSNSLTSEERMQRTLLDKLPMLPKNSLRQPIVEKILNQMINVVNALVEKHGRPDEIRVELARELKQSKEERNETFASLSKRERENEGIRKRITEEYGLRASRNNVIKWRLFHEINNEESKANAICIYCGKTLGITDSLSGRSVDIEHIIPKSLLFDDSQSNKTLSHRSCNEAKKNRTAYDFMKSKPDHEFNQYVERVDDLFRRKVIGKAKRDKLLMPEDKIPKDFIERQLRQTQYVAKKSVEILGQICPNVWSTSGSVTEFLRRIWGWDDALMNLHLPKYRELGLTEWKEWETNDGQKHRQEVIMGWTKRDDHRHHAVDALVIACTQQGFIQRINNLSSRGNRDEMYAELGKISPQGSLLEAYLISQKPFSTVEVQEKAASILVSFKAGKKVATLGSRKVKQNGKKEVVQKGIIVPRGALSEESVYGKIKTIEKNKPLKYLFENPDLIYKGYIKRLVQERLGQNDNDVKKALTSLKKEPIYLDAEKTKLLDHGTCYTEEYVIKYPLEGIKAKDLKYIVDSGIRAIIQARLEQHGNKEKEAFKEPLYSNSEKRTVIKTVRMFTGLSSVEPIKKNAAGENISFVKPGNNHHVAFYADQDGKKVEHICTFWNAVERRKYNFPIVIRDTQGLWDAILADQSKYSQDFLEKLPSDKWTYIESLQQNEMFVLGCAPSIVEDAIKRNDKGLLSNYLFRVQKIAQSNYVFRHHLETQINDSKESKAAFRYYLIQGIGTLDKLNPVKVRLSNLGDIVF